MFCILLKISSSHIVFYIHVFLVFLICRLYWTFMFYHACNVLFFCTQSSHYAAILINTCYCYCYFSCLAVAGNVAGSRYQCWHWVLVSTGPNNIGYWLLGSFFGIMKFFISELYKLHHQSRVVTGSTS